MKAAAVQRLAVLLMDLGALDHFGDPKWELDPVRFDAYARGLARDERQEPRPDSLSVYKRFAEEVLQTMHAPNTIEHQRRVQAEYEWTFASDEERTAAPPPVGAQVIDLQRERSRRQSGRVASRVRR